MYKETNDANLRRLGLPYLATEDVESRWLNVRRRRKGHRWHQNQSLNPGWFFSEFPLGGHIVTPHELCDSEIACARRTCWRHGTRTILCWPTPTKFRMSLSGHHGARGAFWSSSFARPQWLPVVFALASSRVPRANPAMPRYENPDDVEKDNRASEGVRRISRKNCARDGGWFSSPGVVIDACIVSPNCPTHGLLHQHVRLVPRTSLCAASS